ncbi:MAG: pilus assembly protein PilP [Xanthomonadaceae bacterium]|jgi:type IV pilus assembly protein PilP|nr:pilus assembly protein PilP [Xanthomonadaceae bacterium]
MNSALHKPLLLLAVLMLAGCGRGITSAPGDVSNLQRWTEEMRQRPVPPPDPEPFIQQFETFQYTAQNLRDPFSDNWRDPGCSGSNCLRPDDTRQKEPLEQFPLDSLVMAGSIGKGPGLVALVTAPDKTTYRIRPGVYMGQNNGRVTSISENHIDLTELVPDGAGGWEERQASLLLEDR